MPLTLRPHQRDIVDRMLAYDKGQIIVPTGGGKTICMIQDVVENCKYIDNGMTTVVVAPRILLAEQLCSEFLELIDTTHTHVMHVHSGERHTILQQKQMTFMSLLTLLAQKVRTASSSPLIILSIVSWKADIEVEQYLF